MDKNKWWLFAIATVLIFTKSVWLSGAPVGEVAIISVITTTAVIFISKIINWKSELKPIDKQTFFYIIAANIALFILATIHGTFNPMPPNQQGLIDTLKQIGMMRFAVPVVIIAPVIEELLYRRFLIRKSEQTGIRANIKRIIVSSILFGLLHMAYGGSSSDFAFYTTSGVVLGCIYVRRLSITDSVVAHMTYNIVGLLITVLTIR